MISVPLSLILDYEIPSASASLNAIESAIESKRSKAISSTNAGERALTNSSASSSASAKPKASAGHNNDININTKNLAVIFSFSL